MLDVPVVASSGQRAFSRSCCDWLKPLGASEKNGNFQEQMELVNTISRSQSLAMADEYLLQAVDRAWALYQAAHNDVRRRCLSDICSRGGRRERMMLES